jgi:predicted DNA binding CopG/RHH family protein
MNVEDMKLTPEEQEIEDHAEEWVPASEEARENLRRIANRSKKNEAISLRMSSFDLTRIKAMAADQGMPYQTLINVLVHKYVTNQMYEKNEVLKTLRVAKEAGAI